MTTENPLSVLPRTTCDAAPISELNELATHFILIALFVLTKIQKFHLREVK